MSSARQFLTRLIHRQWQHGGWLSTLLKPLGLLAGQYARRRRAAYANGSKPSWRAPVPVIVVGNIFVGGTGKTPVTIALVQALRERGWHPGVISRGYGVDIGATPRCGSGALDAARFGDEPSLIAAATGVPIGVHPRRPLAAQALLAQWPDIDILVCDDGLQHLALQRDVEIVVQDQRGIGNGWLLPAGPLREPPARLQQVDAIITNGGQANTATPADGQPGPLQITMALHPSRFEHLLSGRELTPSEFIAWSTDRRLAAAAGIGNPERYFSMLLNLGLPLAWTLALPDHHDYADRPLDGRAADCILITAKDATKCRDLQDDRLWVVHAAPAFTPPDWVDRLPVPGRPGTKHHAGSRESG